MRAALVALAMAATVACGSAKQDGGGGGGAASGTRTFQLALDPGEPPVTITVAIPSDWRSDGKAPDWKLPALGGEGLVTIAALGWSGDPTAWVAKSIRMQYDEAAQAKAVREDLPLGRVWMQLPEDGGRVHARLFIPFDRGVVMGVAMIPDPDGTRVAAIRAVWETIQVVPTTAK